MTIRELIILGSKKIKSTPASRRRATASRGGSPQLDAEVLLSFALNKSKEYIMTNPSAIVPTLAKKFFINSITKRSAGLPVAYLTGEKEFFNLKFSVNRNVLIPRPETETLVEIILQSVKNRAGLKILDIGTGSGNIIGTLAKNLSASWRSKFFASDVSAGALRVAKLNAKKNQVKIEFKKGSLLEPWQDYKFNVIVANLPYLPKQTDPSTKYEPKEALIAKKNGLDLIEKLLRQISHLATPPSQVFLEIGLNQNKKLKHLAKKSLPEYRTKILKDLHRRNRFVQLIKNPTR